ncbi:carbohydrate porin [Pleurocapsales cyanobacterium LEGE 06147]|nr:carbohydrate porin [Pleurocapsales cyanobacterium LEGE 06147]
MKIKYLLPGLSLLFVFTSVAQAEPLNNKINPIDSEIHFGDRNLNFESNLAERISINKAEFTNYQTNTQSLDPVIIPNDSIAQLTNVSQLRDVQPGDWAYEALRSLVERYGCIVGYPNQTYRGNQSMSRYEFAAGLNACLQQIERLVADSEAVNRDDLETLQRLSKEFEAELATIAGRVDNLEGRVAFLEDHQFSTTTKLEGEVVFGLADAWGGDPPGGCSIVDITQDDQNLGADCTNRTDPDTNTVLAYLARLGLQTSFTGQDRLRMFLTTGNFGFGDPDVPGGGFTNPRSLNTYMARLGYQAGYENQVILDILEYRFPAFNDRVAFYASTFGFALSNVLTANSPFFDIGRGSVSRFGQLNPILRIGGAMDAGVGFDWLIADPLRLQVAYGTRDSGDPGAGVVGADHSALGVQFLVQPTDNIVAGINYVNAYAVDGALGTFTGSVNAETGGLWSRASIPGPVGDSPFADCCPFPLGDQPAQINAVGGSFQWLITEQLTFGAWGGYTFSNFLNELPDEGGFANPFVVGNPPDNGIGASAGKKPFANTATFAVSLGLSDPFGREGDLFGFIFGMPPKLVDAGPETPGTPVPFFEQVIREEGETAVTDNNPNLDTVGTIEGADGNVTELVRQGVLPRRVGQEDEATSLHFEFFYRFKVNDNLWITPGFFFVTNPGHIAANDTIYVGTLRTTFRF